MDIFNFLLKYENGREGGKMKKVLLTVLAISTVLFISACSSKDEKEVLNLHNDIVDELHPAYDEFIDVTDGISMTASDEEVYELYETDLIPIAEKIEKFFDDRDPETEVAQEYYDLRKEEYQYLADFIYDSRDLFSEYIDGTLTEIEFDEQAEVIHALLMHHYEAFEVAEERWEEIFEEYNFREAD